MRHSSDTKPVIHTMNVREFIRGGYREPHEMPTVVLNGDEIAGVWWAGPAAVRLVEPVMHEEEPVETPRARKP